MAIDQRLIAWAGIAPLLINAAVGGATIAVPGKGDLTIQEAIDQADDGDVIIVGPGTYAERIDFGDKCVELRASAGADATTIDGTGLDGAVVTFAGGQGSACVIEGFTVTGGSGDRGGGFHLDGSSPKIVGCVIIGNTAEEGGGLHARALASPILISCTVSSNAATNGGGLFAIGQSHVQLVNTIVSANTASATGGAMCCFGTSGALLANCTVVDNAADVLADGLYNFSDSGATVDNSILWDNGATPIHDAGLSSSLVRYSTVEGGWDGAGFVVDDQDPLFVGAGDLRLRDGSPCIDAGRDALVPVDCADVDGNGDTAERTPLDRDGAPRFAVHVESGSPASCAVVDRGAYEREGAAIGQVFPGDVDRDGIVDVSDLIAVSLDWGACPIEGPEDCCLADVTVDEKVGSLDLVVVLLGWTATGK